MASAAFTRSMAATDSVLWAIERDPELRSTVTAIGMLDRAPDQALLRRRVEAAVWALPRLHQRVLEPRFRLGPPRWVDDPQIDLDYHLRVVAAVPGDTRWLLDYACLLAEAGFDRDRPLWELVVVEGLPDGRAALVQKVHHSLTDGVGAVELMGSMLDWTRYPDQELPMARRDTAVPGGTRQQVAAMIAHLSRTVSAAVPALGRGAVEPVQTVTTVWRTTGSLIRLLAPGRRMSPLFTGRGRNWRFDFHEESLEALRCAGAMAGGTINDVFVAAVAGALRRYHLKHGYDIDALRLTLPVNRRQQGDPIGGNRFTPVRFPIPTRELDATTRIREVSTLCRRWRDEPALPLTDAVATLLGRLPGAATTAVMGSLLKGIDVVATNVRGVPQPCYIAGAELSREFAFAPTSGAALNISLVSHAGTACIGVNMDKAAVTEPELLMTCLGDSLSELVALGGTARRPVEP